MQKYANYPSLEGRCVLITGGGSGIGAAMVEQFAMQGAKVAFLDINEQASRTLVEDVGARCAHRPSFYYCDLSDIRALREAVASVTRACGRPRVLVNNAGSDDRHTFAEVTPEYWDDRIAVNLKHQFFAAQAVAPGMKAAGGGAIVNMRFHRLDDPIREPFGLYDGEGGDHRDDPFAGARFGRSGNSGQLRPARRHLNGAAAALVDVAGIRAGGAFPAMHQAQHPA